MTVVGGGVRGVGWDRRDDIGKKEEDHAPFIIIITLQPSSQSGFVVDPLGC